MRCGRVGSGGIGLELKSVTPSLSQNAGTFFDSKLERRVKLRLLLFSFFLIPFFFFTFTFTFTFIFLFLYLFSFALLSVSLSRSPSPDAKASSLDRRRHHARSDDGGRNKEGTAGGGGRIGIGGRGSMSSLVLPSLGLKDHVGLSMYLHGEEEAEEEEVVGEEKVEMRKLNEFRLGKREEVAVEEEAEVEVESSESSSIGAASSSSSSFEKDEDEEEVESKSKGEGAFGSLDSLEDSLPIKRGLSNFFAGKSKSFASLADVATSAREIAKPENPFNKRRRLLMRSKMRRASYSSLLCPPLPPLLSLSHAVEEADEEGEEEEKEQDHHHHHQQQQYQPQGSSFARFPPLGSHHLATQIKKKPFRSPRSFSLSDLRQA